MYIPIENISRGVDESSHPLLTRTISCGKKSVKPMFMIKALRVLVGTAALKRSNREVVS